MTAPISDCNNQRAARGRGASSCESADRRAAQGRAGRAAKNKQSPIILLNSEGRPWTPDGFRASWGKACKKARHRGGNLQRPARHRRHPARTGRMHRSRDRGPSPATAFATCVRSSTRTICTAIRRLPRAPFASWKWATRNALPRSKVEQTLDKMTDKTVYRVQREKEEKAKRINWLGN